MTIVEWAVFLCSYDAVIKWFSNACLFDRHGISSCSRSPCQSTHHQDQAVWKQVPLPGSWGGKKSTYQLTLTPSKSYGGFPQAAMLEDKPHKLAIWLCRLTWISRSVMHTMRTGSDHVLETRMKEFMKILLCTIMSKDACIYQWILISVAFVFPPLSLEWVLLL